MLLDFDEAATKDGFYWDAVVSLGRQWGRWGLAGESERVLVGARYLLDGRYGAVDVDGMSPAEFARGMVVAGALFWGLGAVEALPMHSVIVMAASSAGAGEASGRMGPQTDAAEYVPSEDPYTKLSERRPEWPVDQKAIERRTPMKVGLMSAEQDVIRAEAAGRMVVFAGGTASGVGRAGRPGSLRLVAITRAQAGEAGLASADVPRFEVVSIRLWHRPPLPPAVLASLAAPSQPGDRPKVMMIDPGAGRPKAVTNPRVHMIIPGETLVATAYGMPVNSKRVIGAPEWMRQDDPQFEITAKIADETFAAMQKMSAEDQQAQMRLMEQVMLAERFGLTVHFEQREMPTYALEVAKGGAKLTAASAGETSKLENMPEGGLKGTAVMLDDLARSPLFLGGRVVVNKTGLTGAYDFRLRFAGESGNDEAPGLYTALQEQMGLRLVPEKGMVEVLVIDEVKRPSEN
jgi:uncharacterized protein (TIGR03435 family)